MTETPRNLLEPGAYHAFLALLRRSWPGRQYNTYKRTRTADAFVLSYPKTGRTWLRIMLGRAIALHLNLQDQPTLDIHREKHLPSGIPRVLFKHDDNPHWHLPQQLVKSKAEYRNSKVVLLVRDPRDTMVSAYFQMTRREQRLRFQGTLDEYLHCPRGSIDSFIAFYNIWAKQHHVPGGFILMRYEDIHANPRHELRRLLDFIGLPEVKSEHLREAVDYASFDHMRQMEMDNHETNSGPSMLQPGQIDDPESYKIRKGKIGGYVDYLSPEQIDYLNEKIKKLDPFFGYADSDASD